jgi:hypothetical protein
MGHMRYATPVHAVWLLKDYPSRRSAIISDTAAPRQPCVRIELEQHPYLIVGLQGLFDGRYEHAFVIFGRYDPTAGD